MTGAGRAARWRRDGVLLLAVALSVLTLIQANHQARKGRGAFLRWGSDHAALLAGEDIYSSGTEEGYPTLPVTLLVMAPFRALPAPLDSLAWAAFKIALAWWIVTRALLLARPPEEPRWPPWALLVVLLLSFRALSSDVLHGNINIVVGATVASAAWSYARARSFASGAWLGLGAALKVTPALGVVLFVVRRDARALLGFLVGVALGALATGPWLGWEHTLELDRAWWAQMVQPYLAGRELTLTQTEQINQSLLGVLGRLFTDSVAIAADPPEFPGDVRISLVGLSPSALRALHVAASVLVLAIVGWALHRSRPRTGAGADRQTLGSFALVSLAMLALSERSWKHHHVLLAFPIAFLVAFVVARPPGAGPTARHRGSTVPPLAVFGLLGSALLHGATGSAFLGNAGSDLAEAYGVYLAGDLVLLLACALLLARSGKDRGEGSGKEGGADVPPELKAPPDALE